MNWKFFKKNGMFLLTLVLIACMGLSLLYIIQNITINRHELESFSGDGGNVRIPKVIFQTSKEPIEDYVVNMIRKKSAGWEYKHFTDQDILAYFEANPMPEFSNITLQFQRLKGAHKADLFRYYYIYLEGGVFLDSDAMIQMDMDILAADCDFFSVNSTCVDKSIFQGFIGAVPKNEIMYLALKHAYTVNPADLTDNYHMLVRELHTIVFSKKFDCEIKLFTEKCIEHAVAYTVDDNNNIVLKHYHTDKVVPFV
jgi:hypothetical protein